MTMLNKAKRRPAARILLVLACALAAIFALAACSGNATTDTNAADQSTPASFTFTDDLDFEVTVTDPSRVVACMGSFANIWELAGGTLIGATDDALADYPLTSAEVASVGDFTAPNLELIISLEPDFVIMTGASTGRDGAAAQVDLRQSLVDSGITVAYFNVTSFDDYLRMLTTCTSITDRADLLELNGTAVQERIDTIVAEVPTSTEAPTVLLMTTYSGGTRVQSSTTMTGIMLSELGAVNMADANPSLLKDFSLEAIIEMNPDFILVVPMGNDDEAALKNLKESTEANPAWAGLQAVQNGNYQTLDKSLFLYKPNDRWDQSYQTLFDILYAK